MSMKFWTTKPYNLEQIKRILQKEELNQSTKAKEYLYHGLDWRWECFDSYHYDHARNAEAPNINLFVSQWFKGAEVYDCLKYLKSFENLSVDFSCWTANMDNGISKGPEILFLSHMSINPGYNNPGFIKYIWAVLVRQVAYGLGRFSDVDEVLHKQYGGGESLLDQEFLSIDFDSERLKILDDVELMNHASEHFRSVRQSGILRAAYRVSRNLPA